MSGEKVKTRKWQSPPQMGRKRSSGFVPFGNYTAPGYDNQETVWTTSHARLPGGRWSGGGPFKVVRTIEWMEPSLCQVTGYAANGTTLLKDGTVHMLGPTTAVPELQTPAALSDSELLALGSTAIARVMPTNPAFDLSTALGEILREGIPNIPGSHAMNETKLAKAAGSNYLNVEFGWLPLVRSIRDFADVTARADDIVRKYQEESGKTLARRYDWPIEQSYQTNFTSFNMTEAMGFFTGGYRQQHRTRRVWFEGDFTYYLPTGGEYNDKFRHYASLARKLYGIDLSPEVLWNLAPWSWAVDWFSNAGDVIHNISAIGQDGMVMRYAYIMCHTKHEFTDVGYHNGTRFVRKKIVETKRRLPATPYGFGVSFGSLSPRQIAILSALGLSRW